MAEGKLRYHPMLDWNSKMIWEYRKEYNLPEHPLEAQGYLKYRMHAMYTFIFETNDAGKEMGRDVER